MIPVITGSSRWSSSWKHQALQPTGHSGEVGPLVVPSSCLEGLGALGTGQTKKRPRAVTALTRWHSLVPQGQASGHFWKG